MAKKQKKLDEISKKFGDERQKALDNALKNIEKDFGKGAIMRLGERAEQKVQVMSSGSLALDIALGAGGYPKGRIIEIYGPESSGKTTVALHAVAQAQKEGGIAAFIDAEHALDPSYAAALGVNIDDLLRSQYFIVLYAHPFANITLHPRKSETNLVSQKLANCTNTTVPQVVNIIHPTNAFS